MSLPQPFRHLEPFVALWDLPTSNDRYRRRLDTPLADMQRFNDAIVADADAIKSHLDAMAFADYTQEDRRLTRLMLAFTIVAQAVQIYRQPAVPDSGSVPMFDFAVEPWEILKAKETRLNTPRAVYANGVSPDLLQKAGEKWIDKYPHLDRNPVSYENAVSPDFYFYDLEREAVFRRNWLYVGRTEWVAAPGKFYTKEIEVCKTSVIVVRGRDAKVRAFHNVCPHRGNKLVWEGNPSVEVEGKCSRFYCKYHGLGFGLDGKVEHLTDAQTWYGEQGTGLKLAEIPCEEWNGFLFVNLTPGGPAETLREFLGEYYWNGFDGYPFESLIERYVARGTVQSNWKTLMDAFNEVYHGVFVHQQSFPYLQQFKNDELQAIRNNVNALVGRHGFYISPRNPQGLFVTDLERISVTSGTGPQYPFAIDLASKLPKAANPLGTDDWGTSSHFIFPNTQIQFYYPGWYLTYQYWPLAHNKMRFEIDVHHLPSRNFSELLSHYAHMSIFLDAALQDVNNLEATQRGLESGVFDQWPLTDEEIIVRGFHKQIYECVDRYQRGRGAARG